MTDGFVMVPNSLVKSDISKWAKLIWIMLKYHTDQNGGCRPSVAMLAKLADMSPRQVRYALNELKDAGLVESKSRPGCCSVYTLPALHHMPTPAYGAGEVGTGCRGGLHTVQDTPLSTDSDEQYPINKTRKKRVLMNGHTVFPPELTCSEFETSWKEWIEHRRQIKCPLTELAGKKQLKRISAWGSKRAIAAIENSIRRGWRDIFEEQQRTNGYQPRETFNEAIDRLQREEKQGAKLF